MASVVTEVAATLLIFTCVVHGTRSLQIDHKESLNATVGQNISLPCIVTEEKEININQIQWHTEIEQRTNKLVVYNPHFSAHYYVPAKLEMVNKSNTTKLRGSILHLFSVTKENSGEYVCEISTFPGGSFKSSTRLQVTEPWISAKIVSPGESVVEGDEVNITCASNPPADQYALSSAQSSLSLKSQSGHFTLKNVSRRSSDLICQPLWNSSNQHLHSLSANVRLTVDFLDSIRCNSSSEIQLETGMNLTIPCEATSSKPLYYTWKKSSMTVSQNATISVWSVNPDDSGMYSLIVSARNHSRLQRQKDFEVTVFNRTNAVELLSTTMTMETTSQATEGTTHTTAGPSTTPVTTQPGHVISTAYTTSTKTSLYINTTTPSAGNITASQAHITTAQAKITAAGTVENSTTWSSSLYTSAEGSTLSERQNATSTQESTRAVFTSLHPQASRTIFSSTSMSKATLIMVKDEKEQSGSKTHAVFVLIPILLLLVLIGFLYRRYLIQKRMDMPPPFKPPPPPVKYTSVRSQDIPVTDILV